jgi:hypothetical protein
MTGPTFGAGPSVSIRARQERADKEGLFEDRDEVDNRSHINVRDEPRRAHSLDLSQDDTRAVGSIVWLGRARPDCIPKNPAHLL